MGRLYHPYPPLAPEWQLCPAESTLVHVSWTAPGGHKQPVDSTSQSGRRGHPGLDRGTVRLAEQHGGGQIQGAMSLADRSRRVMVQGNHQRWLESSDVIPTFPSLVWKLQVEANIRDGLREKILATIAEIRAGLPPLAPGDGWQSGQALHKREASLPIPSG